MRVVIIDDDLRKQERLSEVIRLSVGNITCDIECGLSVSDGVKLLDRPCDLLILDLNLPIRAYEKPLRDGGIRLLKQIIRGRPVMIRPHHILGVTAHVELLEEGQREFKQEAWELLRCDPGAADWEIVVQNKAMHVASQSVDLRNLEYHTDVAIITALKEVEFDAVRNLQCLWSQKTIGGDDTVYYTGQIEGQNKTIRLIAATALEMGVAASAALVTKLSMTFRPKYLIMVGIAAGVNGSPGDILIADESWDYGSGKFTTTNSGEQDFQFGAKHIQIDPGLKEKVGHFVRERKDIISGIQNDWQGNRCTHALQVLIGPFASGNAVIENKEKIDQIRTQDRKLIGFDMEAYGVFAATRITTEPRPKCMVVKSICDFGTLPKTDEWQRYAAFTSANFVHSFISECLALDC